MSLQRITTFSFPTNRRPDCGPAASQTDVEPGSIVPLAPQGHFTWADQPVSSSPENLRTHLFCLPVFLIIRRVAPKDSAEHPNFASHSLPAGIVVKDPARRGHQAFRIVGRERITRCSGMIRRVGNSATRTFKRCMHQIRRMPCHVSATSLSTKICASLLHGTRF